MINHECFFFIFSSHSPYLGWPKSLRWVRSGFVASSCLSFLAIGILWRRCWGYRMRRTSRKARNCRTQSPSFCRTWWSGRPGTSRRKPLCRRPWPWHLRRTFRPSRPREAGPNLRYKWRCKWWARLSAARIFAPPRHPRVALLLGKNTSPEQSAIQIHDHMW